MTAERWGERAGIRLSRLRVPVWGRPCARTFLTARQSWSGLQMLETSHGLAHSVRYTRRIIHNGGESAQAQRTRR